MKDLYFILKKKSRGTTNIVEKEKVNVCGTEVHYNELNTKKLMDFFSLDLIRINL